jgi:cation transport regulator ChaC
MGEHTIDFNEEAGAALEAVIDRMPGLRESLEESGIDWSTSGTSLHIFGYGSLPDKPHTTEGLSLQKGLLHGYKSDFCCDCPRSGTQSEPGLVVGLEQDVQAIQAGSVMSYEGLSVPQIVENLTAFADRETMEVNGVPIYSFEIQEIEVEGGEKIACLTCVANTDAPGYAGDRSFDERTDQMAFAHNVVCKIEDRSLHAHMGENASTVKNEGDIRTNASYYTRFALLTAQVEADLRGQENKADKTPFEQRYNAACEEYLHRMTKYDVAIQDKRDGLDSLAQQFFAEIECHQAEKTLAQLSNGTVSGNAEKRERMERALEKYIGEMRERAGVKLVPAADQEQVYEGTQTQRIIHPPEPFYP